MLRSSTKAAVLTFLERSATQQPQTFNETSDLMLTHTVDYFICSLKLLPSHFPYTYGSDLRVPLQRTRQEFHRRENHLTFGYNFFLTSEARHIWTYPGLSPRELVPKLQDQTCISTYFDPQFLFHFVTGKGQIFSVPAMPTTCSVLTSLLRPRGFV